MDFVNKSVFLISPQVVHRAGNSPACCAARRWHSSGKLLRNCARNRLMPDGERLSLSRKSGCARHVRDGAALEKQQGGVVGLLDMSFNENWATTTADQLINWARK